MARLISISFNWCGNSERIHQMRNFGEDLHRALKIDGWAEVALNEVDKATDHLTVTVFSGRRVRRINAIINKLLSEHALDAYAVVSVGEL
jgi:hypothetical protein